MVRGDALEVKRRVAIPGQPWWSAIEDHAYASGVNAKPSYPLAAISLHFST